MWADLNHQQVVIPRKYRVKYKMTYYHTIFNALNVAIFVHDISNKNAIIDINQKAIEMFGYNLDEAKLLTVTDLSCGDLQYSRQEVQKLMEAAGRGESKGFGWRARHKDGRCFWAEVCLKCVNLNGKLFLLSIIDDISQRKQTEMALEKAKDELEHRVRERTAELIAVNQSLQWEITVHRQIEEKLKYRSQHDIVTGLHNRAYFMEAIHQVEGKRCFPIGFIICDVDGLKLVNDTLGHEEGDRLLITAAEVIKKCFHDDDIVARVGGDEFAIMLPDTSTRQVKNAAQRIRDSVKIYNENNSGPPLSISVGFSVTEDGSIYLLDVYKQADNNMYREKLYHSQSARNAIVRSIMETLESRDFIDEGHASRLEKMSVAFGQMIGLSQQNLTDICILAQFHDIGKVGVPGDIIFKPGALSIDETFEMRRHCEIGHRIAQSSPDLVPVAEWILKHHEWWNGEGYPLGLKGEQIPLECRILAIADAYDAMTNDRPYRKAMSQKDALNELKSCAGSQFDPDLVAKFIQFVGEAQ